MLPTLCELFMTTSGSAFFPKTCGGDRGRHIDHYRVAACRYTDCNRVGRHDGLQTTEGCNMGIAGVRGEDHHHLVTARWHFQKSGQTKLVTQSSF